MNFNLPALTHPCWAVACTALERGASQLVDRFGKRIAVQSKGLANFVSEADLAAESAVLDTIREAFPEHALLSEESHQSTATEAEHLWIVDPLDGTSNFLHGIPHFAVSIAYYCRGQPAIGLVANPITGDCYASVAGQGAWYRGVRQTVSDSERLDQVVVCCGFYYDRGRMMQATLDTLADLFQRNIHGMRRFGAAALDLCNVGCGQYGLFFEYKLHPWDYAAGQLFLREAGGTCTDCDGRSLPLDKPSSICATNTKVHSESLAVITPHWNQYLAS